MKLRVIWIGKTRDPGLCRLLDDYSSRIQRFLSLELVELKDARVPETARKRMEGEKILSVIESTDRVIALDPGGKTWTSEQFAGMVGRHMREDPRRLTFVIGGFSGLADSVKERSDITWALSSLTFTHDMCRVLLLEQIYRAL